MRPVVRIAGWILLALAVVYAGDDLSARFRLPGNRQTLENVQVQTMWEIKQKNGRMDYELGDTATETCLLSLFPHLGYAPCWYLKRHTSKIVKVGRAGRPVRVRSQA